MKADLHHSNVDRLFAMWQVVHPDAYTAPKQAARDGTVTYQSGDLLDLNTSQSSGFLQHIPLVIGWEH